MTGMTVLESLQYVDDALLEEAEVPAAKAGHWKRWGAAAACLVLLAGAALALGLPDRLRRSVQPYSGSSPVYLTPGAEGYVNLPAVQTTVQPGGSAQGGALLPAETPAPMPGGVQGTPGNLVPPERGEPEVFAWSDTAYPIRVYPVVPGQEGMEVILVGQALTSEQVRACAPEIRLEWMQDFSGAATYKLADGSGGLSCVELWVTHEDQGNTCRITLREATAENLAACGLNGESLPSINYQGYRAWREYDDGDDGERVSVLVAFEKDGVLYTLETDAPAEQEKYAEIDLRDLLLAYAGTHGAPDLGSFVYDPEG